MTTYKALLLVISGFIGLCLFFSLGFIIGTHNSPLTALDQAVQDYAISTRTPERTTVMTSITNLGGDEASTIALVVVVIMMIASCWRIAACTALGFWIMSILTNHFKAFFDIARPGDALQATGGMSYPSGHTTNISIICFMAGWVILTAVKSRAWKIIGIVICGLVALLVGVSRIYLGVHWISDVYGAYLLTGSIGIIIVGLSELINHRKQHAR